MPGAKDEQVMVSALRALRQGRTPDAMAALQDALADGREIQAAVRPGRTSPRAPRGSVVAYHVLTVPGIPSVTSTTAVTPVKIQWPSIGANMRVIGMTGTIQAAAGGAALEAAMNNISLGLECNELEKFASSGRTDKQIPYACLFPVSQPKFEFATPRRPYGVPVFSTENWTAFFLNEGGTGAGITPTLEFLIESDLAGTPPSFDVASYGKRLGVHLMRHDQVASIPNALGPTNPSTSLNIFMATPGDNKRLVAWIGAVLSGSAANAFDLANSGVMVTPNGAENLVTNGQVGNAFASMASLFGSVNGRPERWLPLASKGRYGIDVWPDEQWQVLFQNLGGASGGIVPLTVFRVEND